MTKGKVQTDIMQAYADGLKVIWAVMCGVAFIGLVMTAFTREYTLDGPKNLGDTLAHQLDVEEGPEKSSISSRGN